VNRRLAAATALLESVRTLVSKAPVPDTDWNELTFGECDTAFAVLAELRDLLSRAPAQPAAPFPAQALEMATSRRMQPAAPEPEMRGDYGIGFAAACQPYAEDQQPAAPEPSAEHECREFSAAEGPVVLPKDFYVRGYQFHSRRAEAAETQLASSAQQCAYANIRLAHWVERAQTAESQLEAANKRIDAYERAASDDELRCEIQTLTGEKEAAEAQLAAVRAELLLHCQDANALAGQLAAVRERVKEAHRITAQLKASFEEWPDNTSDNDLLALDMGRILQALTPAPSPGAGEKP
jgi:hypothetical protein